MRAAILVVLVACSKTSSPAPPAASASTSAALPSASAPAAASDTAETDYQGTFNGAKLVATLEMKSGSITGSCFYEAVGIDIPIQGTATGGAITLSEMKDNAPISTITLTRGADGTLAGTWKTPDKSGPALLTPVAHKAGDPVAIVKRALSEKSDAICGWNGKRYTTGTIGDTKPRGPCHRTGSAPVVLGLVDRAFEKKLDEALLQAARMQPPDNPVGLGIDVTWSTEMNARGILSVILTGSFRDATTCPKGAPGDDCYVDLYAPGHRGSTTSSVMAAIDAAVIAKSPADFIDLAKARAEIKPIIEKGFSMCVMSFDGDDPIKGVGAALLTEQGVKIEHDNCTNHVFSDAWAVIPYAKVKPALKTGTPFEPAWK